MLPVLTLRSRVMENPMVSRENSGSENNGKVKSQSGMLSSVDTVR